ncbi:hypothetical protein tloyanaT_25790 [Thalassotalea loyana]|uniref:DUF551 domain-containing protein n=1 Tax=Thalassotalea loyana TaxID=280483 RepID=A0ABQ6HHG3_9GAMM|nr:DUF551 domain-containing protein [Thalassotalea loyana]GLX86326.1 hypothetical protein tloyanaT_25790 [Thalassotalea loyana]
MKWIDVEKEYPSQAGRYLVVLRVGSMTPKSEVTMRRLSKSDVARKNTNLGDWQKMTHWMQIPELPSTQK